MRLGNISTVAPAPSSLTGSGPTLDKLFDGRSVPGAQELLARASASGVSLNKIGEAITQASTPESAAKALERLNVLKPGEVSIENQENLHAWYYALHRLWFESAPNTPLQLEIDESWPVPALVAHNGKRTYYVHGVLHGSLLAKPFASGPVKRLVEVLKARALPLYWEQNLPEYFHSSYGREIIDYPESHSTPYVKEAPPVPSPSAQAVKLALMAAAWAAPAAAMVSQPSTPRAALLAAITAIYVLAYAHKPSLYLLHHILGIVARLQGHADLTHHLHKKGSALYGWRWDLSALRRVELPMPLKVAEGDWTATRARQIAELVSADAARRGYDEVHIATGQKHAQESAWYLGRPKDL